jgi:hypothetical protein
MKTRYTGTACLNKDEPVDGLFSFDKYHILLYEIRKEVKLHIFM